jgi:hypothetical protein
MPEYRIDFVGALGHSLRSIRIDCTDDRGAIESAKQFIDCYDIELWRLDRQIARFGRVSDKTTGRPKGRRRIGPTPSPLYSSAVVCAAKVLLCDAYKTPLTIKELKNNEKEREQTEAEAVAHQRGRPGSRPKAGAPSWRDA